jgi:hypothetical protein
MVGRIAAYEQEAREKELTELERQLRRERRGRKRKRSDPSRREVEEHDEPPNVTE